MAYADENYMQQKNLYDTVSQVFENYKYGATSIGHSWNMPVEEIRGITLRYLGDNLLELTYHRYEVDTVEGLHRSEPEGQKFLSEVVKALKKEFKSATGETLEMKKVRESPVYYEKVSRLSAETSWMLGSSRYGHGARPVGRYLAKTICVYDFSANL